MTARGRNGDRRADRRSRRGRPERTLSTHGVRAGVSCVRLAERIGCTLSRAAAVRRARAGRQPAACLGLLLRARLLLLRRTLGLSCVGFDRRWLFDLGRRRCRASRSWLPAQRSLAGRARSPSRLQPMRRQALRRRAEAASGLDDSELATSGLTGSGVTGAASLGAAGGLPASVVATFASCVRSRLVRLIGWRRRLACSNGWRLARRRWYRRRSFGLRGVSCRRRWRRYGSDGLLRRGRNRRHLICRRRRSGCGRRSCRLPPARCSRAYPQACRAGGGASTRNTASIGMARSAAQIASRARRATTDWRQIPHARRAARQPRRGRRRGWRWTAAIAANRKRKPGSISGTIPPPQAAARALEPNGNAVTYWDSRMSRVRRRESGLR